MQASPGTIVCKSGDDPAIYLREGEIFVKSQMRLYHVTLTLTLTLTLSTPWMQARPWTIMYKFGGDPVICLREEAIFVKPQMRPYHVTLDLDLDVQHNLDAGLPADRRVQVWSRSSHPPPRTSDFSEITRVSMSCDL